jgi:hypothetical protein
MATRIQVRRDSAANWTSNNPTLADGEIGFETDTGLFKIGTNNTSWASLEYAQVSAQGYNLLNGTVTLFDSYSQEELSTIGTVPELPYQLKVYTSVDNYAYTVGDTVKIKNFYDVEDVNPNLSASATSVEALDSSIYSGYATFNLSEPISVYSGQYIIATDPNNPGWVQLCQIITISGTEVFVSYSTMTLPESPTTSSEWIIERDTDTYYNSPLPQYYDSNRDIVGHISGVGSSSYIIDILNSGTARWESNTCNVSLSGMTGPIGYTGQNGSPGSPGSPGDDGTDGADGMDGLSAYEIWINEGNSGTEEDFFNSLQGPGYEVTWVDGTHSLPDDPQTNWMIGQTVWKAGDQYNIPGDFTNSAYKVGDYVKHLFNTGSYETDWWIEGWITAISTPGATISVQRWGNTDWNNLQASSSPGSWRTTYAHFEPGYNFDTYLSFNNTYATLNIPLSYNYLNYKIQNPALGEYIELSGHLGSYKPGDYVVVSSKSNPLIKFIAYLVHAGLAGINSYASTFYPIEILSWDGDPDTGIEDFTLSPMPTPEVGYSFPFPYPNPTKATLDTPAFNVPMAYSALTTQTYPLLINDVIQVRGVTGLYEVGDKVRAYDPYDKDAQFYGEISSIGSASNEWVSEITVKDPTVFTSSASTSNHNYKIALEERKAPLLSENIYPSYDGNSEYYIQSSDIGKTIIANGGVVTYVVSNSSEIPPGSQVTIIQSGGSSGDVGIRGATFIETDGITDGQVQLKGPYGAATIVKIWGTTASGGSEWIVVGNFLSATPPPGGGP